MRVEMKNNKFDFSIARPKGTSKRILLLHLFFLTLLFAGCDLWKNRENSSDRPVIQAKWKQAELIERVQGKINFHSLAVDLQGNAIAVWMRDDFFGNEALWSSHSKPNESWSLPEGIETVYGRPNALSLAIDGKGNAIAIWEHADESSTGIWSNFYTPKNGWGLTEQTEFSRANAFEPQGRFLADGLAIAVWAQKKGRRVAIWANTYKQNKGWSRPRQIDAPPGDGGGVGLASSGRGRAVAVWEQGGAAKGSAIFANYFTPGKTWGRAVPISNGLEKAIKPRVAMDGDGNAIVVWEQTIKGEETVWGNRFRVGKGWDGPVVIEEAEHEGYAPEIAMDQSGNAIAVWTREIDDRELVWAAHYLKGQGWQKPQRIQTVDAEYAYLPNVAFNSNGDALATWYQIDLVYNNVWISRYTPKKGWGKAHQIENRTSVAFKPLVLADPTGGFIVFWKMIDGVNPANSIHTLWARRVR